MSPCANPPLGTTNSHGSESIGGLLPTGGRSRKQGKACGTEVLCGIEAEVFPVAEELEEMKALLQAHPFDFVLGSLHHQLKAYHDWLEDRKVVSDEDIIRDYFKHLANAAQSGLYHSMSHPDVIRIYGTIDPESFIPQRFETEIRGFLKACATSACVWKSTQAACPKESTNSTRTL